MGESAELSAEQRASLIVPIAWFHVPKTGTSFLNTFYHTPAICPTFHADNYMSTPALQWDSAWGEPDVVCAGGFSTSYPVVIDHMIIDHSTPCHERGHFSGHMGIGVLSVEEYRQNRGHFVAMFRQPEQRLISQYYDYGPSSLWKGGVKVWPYQTESPSLLEYAEWNAGVTVRQLTKSVCMPFKVLPLPTSEDLSAAIDILKEGFAFVGITEQWALSVCLFRAMFGGQCLLSDLGDARPGEYSNGSDYDTAELNGWVDVWDGPVYAEAVSIFDSTRNVYGVTSEWCSSICQGHVDEQN